MQNAEYRTIKYGLKINTLFNTHNINTLFNAHNKIRLETEAYCSLATSILIEVLA